MTVRTRFAPSPTGFMHIGGMRTALFAWLTARAAGGEFILRIDDTDRSRNVDEALEPILDAFAWLGLDWDEGPEFKVQGKPVGGGNNGPYFQSQRSELYRDAIERLIQSGSAYRDFETPDQTRLEREAAEKEKRTYISSRRSLQLTPEEREQRLGEPHVVRLLVPRDAIVSIHDDVRGDVRWECREMPDPVLARADGSPLYNLASAVDDGLMKITHVVRAEEHLSNVPIQCLLFDALGFDRPTFAHIPFVTAPGTTKKLSKREKDLARYRELPQFKSLYQIADRVLPKIGRELDATMNPVMVAFYREVGFLPEAVLNTLARLGWSIDDHTEAMSLPFVREHFSLDRVVKAPAGLDCEKMLSFQEHWVGELDSEEKRRRCRHFLDAAGIEFPEASFKRLIEVLGDRIKLFSDILKFDEFFVADEALTYDAKAWKKRITKAPEAKSLLEDFLTQVAKLSVWDAASIESAMNEICHTRDCALGTIVHPVRVATTGKAAGAGLFETLEILGQESVVNRLQRAIARIEELSA